MSFVKYAQINLNFLMETTKINDFNQPPEYINIPEWFDLCSSFMKVYEKEFQKLPYHINLLDIFWAKENIHSRILGELFKQNTDQKYEVLESFITYLKTIKQTHIKIKKPNITVERERIDILIREHDYALIIENKIHDADDQPNQLARYIDKMKKEGLKDSQIYIIYLTRDGSKIPSVNSWTKINGVSYQEEFKNRYFALNFRDDILPWLSEFVLPNCRLKDVFLKSTVEQYVDFFEGLFNKRKINKNMNIEIENQIKMELKLSSNPIDNYEILTKKREELNKLQNSFFTIIENEEKKCWDTWSQQIRIDFPNDTLFDEHSESKYPKVGFKMKYNDIEFCVIIEKETNLFYGVSKIDEKSELNNELKDILKDLLYDFAESEWYYGWIHVGYSEAYNKLTILFKEVKRILKEYTL